MDQMVNKDMSSMEMSSATMGATKKEGKGMMVGMICCALLAVGGIGFGIYEMSQVKTAKQQISDMKIEVKNNDGSTTILETDKIEVKEDTKTVTITDSPIITLGILDISKTLNWSEETKAAFDIALGHQTMAGYGAVSSDSKSISISSIARNLYGELPNANTQATISSLGGRIVDFYVGGFGQAAGYETLFMIIEDGSIEYVPLYYAVKNNDYTAHKVDGVSGIIRFSTASKISKAETGGGVTTLGIKSDGSWYDMYSVLDIRNSQYYNNF